MQTAGIDIGTTSLCLIIADVLSGKALRTITRPNDAGLASSRSWEALQQPDRIVRLVQSMIAECGDEWRHVGAIGISCQMHGIVYVDGSGQAVGPLVTWQDRRGEELIDAGGSTYAARLEALTGYRLATGYGLVTHAYNAAHGEVPAEAVALCAIGDYVAMKLCGAAAPVTDASNAAGFGLFSLGAQRFDLSAMAKAGLDAAILPRVAGAGDTAGRTPDGKLVACAIGDNQASFLGAVKTLKGSLLFNIGTGAQVSAFSPEAMEGEGIEARPCPGGGYLLVGASLNGGKSYALLERFFRETCRAFMPEFGDGRSLYARMNELALEAMAEAGPDFPAGLANGPQVGTLLYGTRQSPGATGYITGLRPSNLTPKHLIVGWMNGIIEELLGFVEVIPQQLRAGVTSVSASGNGIRRNPAMRRLLQARLGQQLFVADVEEEAAFGAALHAAVAAGYYDDHEAALLGMHRGFDQT
ncbi:sedoheptulokinase [Paenibacillus validus]|uniref:Carbohydrate kinase FGGY N-terminal domain-containing protein n=3 Tax=Paenibacillus validus TaxID=44253 RepID=A0A7X2Z868_9BACL|nr:FGGY family carbohydrate kinase [Paenibacillus validus]MUG69473.1 hypothetical protein [Paenibacillus validus]